MRGNRPELLAASLRAENPGIEERIQKWLTGVDGPPYAHWFYRGPRERGAVRYKQIAIRNDGRWTVEYVHRVMFALHRGDIPAGYEVSHECQTKWCVRPDHMELRLPAEHRLLDAAFRKFVGGIPLNNILYWRIRKEGTD